jgi:hypothetical protein
MPTITIDGNAINGTYMVSCGCGDQWAGRSDRLSHGDYSPARPIAEAVVHWKLEHGDQVLNIDFDQGMRQWLIGYWDWHNRRHTRPMDQWAL